MVLIDRDAVEADFGGQLEFIEIAIVKFVTLLGIVIGVRQNHPRRAVLVLVGHVQVRIGHQMEKEDFHCIAPRTNFTTSVARASGCS